MMRGWMKAGVSLSLSAVLLAGCSWGSDKEAAVNKEVSTLKVMYFNESYFFQDYGMLFSSIYPDIEIEVVNSSVINDAYLDQHDQDYAKALQAFIEAEQPDVIMLDDHSVTSQLVEIGTLYDLESLLTEKSYHADGLIPGVLDYMKELGLGKVYTIPTAFSTQVLYYNKALFDQFNIPYPTDGMTWNELITVAKQFPVSGEPTDRLFGLRMGYSKNIGEIVTELAQSQGINFFDGESLNMTIDTPAWASLIEQAKHLMENDTLFYDDMLYTENSGYQLEDAALINDPFLNGRLAMKLDTNHYINQLEEAQKNSYNDKMPIWDLVTAPVNPQTPDSTYSTYYYSLVAINAASTNIDAAWKYISYITSDEYARVVSKVSYSNTPIRTKYIEKDSERNYAALYKLKPMKNQLYSYYNVPQRFLMEFVGVLEQTLSLYIEDQLTLEEALAQLQLKGNELLSTERMTQEEFDQYWEENNIPGVILQ